MRYLIILFCILNIGARPLSVFQHPELMKDVKNMVHIRTELRTINNIAVLDVGSGDGQFLPAIYKYLKQKGYDEIKIVGIENGSEILGELEDYRELLLLKHGEGPWRLIQGDIRTHRNKYDLVTIMASHRNFTSIVMSSIKNIRDEGLMIVRFAQGEEWKYEELQVVLKEMPVETMLLDSDLPDTHFELADQAMLIKKRPFVNTKLQLTGVFAELIESYRHATALRRSA